MLFLVERESKRRITRGNIIASRLRAYFLCVCSNKPGLRKKNITTKLSKILLSSIYSKFSSSSYSSYGDNKERKTLFLTNEFFLEELEGKYRVEGGVISSLFLVKRIGKNNNNKKSVIGDVNIFMHINNNIVVHVYICC